MGFLRSTLAGVLCLSLATAILTSCASTPEARSARFIENGKNMMKKNDAARAILQFQNAVKVTPRNAEAYYQLATAFMAAGDPVRTGRSLRKALELDPKHEGALLLTAKLMAATNDKDVLVEAQERLRALLRDAPDNPDALQTLALTEIKLGAPDEGMADLGRAMAAAPGSLLIAVTLAKAKLQENDPKGAEEVLKQARQNAPKSVDAVVVLGKFYSAQGRPAEAEQQFQQALAMDAKNADALFSLGVLQNKLGHKQAAEETFRKLSRMPAKEYRGSLAAFLFQENRQDEALQELTRLVREDPADRTLRTRLVNSYLAANRAPEAEKVLKDALKKNPKDLDALLQRAEMAITAGNFNQAESDLNEVMHLQPSSPEPHYVLGRLYLARKEEPRYRQELFEALKRNPRLQPVRLELAQDLMNNNQARAALDLLDAAPEDQKASLAMLVQRNWVLWALGDLAEMRKGIDKGLAQKRSADLLIQDGLWKLKAGDAKTARAELEEALKINPEDLRALWALKGSYEADKNGKMALQKVKEYAALHPKSAPVQDFLGAMLSGSDPAQARAALMAAKAADPKYAKADFDLVQLDVMEGKWADAGSRLQTVLANDPGNPTARLWLGDVEAVRGDPGTALDQYRKSVANNPNDARALNNLAYVLAAYSNRPDEALKYAEKAVELAPANPDYADTLGWVLYQKGLYSAAVQQLERAASQKGNVAWRYHLAMAYAKAGQSFNAQATLNSALKQNSKAPEAQAALAVVREGK